MSIQYRIAGPNDRDAIIDFINYVFSHDHAPHDFRELLPDIELKKIGKEDFYAACCGPIPPRGARS